MPGIAVLELAGFEIEDSGERGDEQHFGIVARHFGIGRRHELADVGVRARSVALLYSALLTAMKMLAESPLPATSPTRKKRRRSSRRK